MNTNKTMTTKAKKCIAMLLCIVLVLCLASCGSDNGTNSDSEKLKIGILKFGEFTALTNATQGFIDGLAEAGYVDGENITIHELSAAAETGNCPSIADTLINENSDLILAVATPSASAVKEKNIDHSGSFHSGYRSAASGLVASNEAPRRKPHGHIGYESGIPADCSWQAAHSGCKDRCNHVLLQRIELQSSG